MGGLGGLGRLWVVMSEQVRVRNGIETGGKDYAGSRGAGEPCSELETPARWALSSHHSFIVIPLRSIFIDKTQAG